jgi:hypothetical protein
MMKLRSVGLGRKANRLNKPSPQTSQYAPWYGGQRKAWLEEVHAWLRGDSALQSLGGFSRMQIVRERPWSLIARVFYANRTVYFKACAAGGKHEAALLAYLQPHWPDCMPVLLAHDAQRAWVVLADAGRPVRDVSTQRGMRMALSQMLSSYATLQIQTLTQVPALEAIGLPCRPVQALPQLIEQLLNSGAHASGLSAHEADALAIQVRRQLGFAQTLCDELAATPYAYALDHGDLHTGNILKLRNSLVLVDWGDACMTYPFCSAFVAIQFSAESFAPGRREAVLAQWRDAYLVPWQQFAEMAVLQRHFAYALWLGRLVRALDYAEMFTGAPEVLLAPWRARIGKALQHWVNTRPAVDRADHAALLPLIAQGLGPAPPVSTRLKNALRGTYVRLIKGQ